MIKKILLGIVALIALVLIVAAFQPADYKVERRINIAVAPGAVFGHVNDLSKWSAWSPWEKLDPEMKKTFSGPASGVGASYGWTGNSKVGEGRMTITESRPAELVRINLEFLKPFEASSTTDFTFKPEGNQTVVTWTMVGKNNYMSKVMCMFMNMDKMVGGDFERGLDALRSVAEGKSRT